MTDCDHRDHRRPSRVVGPDFKLKRRVAAGGHGTHPRAVLLGAGGRRSALEHPGEVAAVPAGAPPGGVGGRSPSRRACRRCCRVGGSGGLSDAGALGCPNSWDTNHFRPLWIRGLICMASAAQLEKSLVIKHIERYGTDTSTPPSTRPARSPIWRAFFLCVDARDVAAPPTLVLSCRERPAPCWPGFGVPGGATPRFHHCGRGRGRLD